MLSNRMSYGRASAIFNWVFEHWREFDTWCCIRGLDPLDLPAYRFYNIALHILTEEMNPEQLAQFEYTLQLCDATKHPLHNLQYKLARNTETRVPEPSTTEDRKKYIPSWWKGDQANYSNAMVAMKGVSALPKMAQ